MPAPQAAARPAPLSRPRFTPLGPVLGAEVSGVDLRRPLDSTAIDDLKQALFRHKVLVFRDQDITHAEHIRFGRYFGELEGHPVTAHVPGHPEILHIEAGDGLKLTDQMLPLLRPANKWHTDVTFREKPSFAGILRARALPPIGGDTLFADTAAVYNDLPENVKNRIETLDAEHDILQSFGWRITEEKREQLRREHPPQIHPVVRRHPVTGERHLFVNHVFTTRIIGLPEEESKDLLAYLIDRVKTPEYQVRVRWTPNTITVWDNQATQHYAILDYWPAERVMERVTVAGTDRPVR
jgi:taurine dioxygenase